MVGKSKGLRLVLDQQTNRDTFSTVQDDFYGLQLFIGTPEEFPMMRDRSILLQPGHENYVEVSGYVIKSTPDVRSLATSQRKCLFEDEGSLDFYSCYSYSNCKFECVIKSVSAKIGCKPWYMPRDNITKVCDPWQALEFSNLLDTERCNISCLPDCNTIIYSSPSDLSLISIQAC